MRSNIWTLPSRAVPSLDSSKKRIIQYKNNHLNEMCWKIAGLDAFGFDALSKDRMFTKKSTPSAIADIRIPKWKLKPKEKHSSSPKTHTTSPYWTKPTRFNCRRLPIRECSPKSMQSHMTTLTTGQNFRMISKDVLISSILYRGNSNGAEILASMRSARSCVASDDFRNTNRVNWVSSIKHTTIL